MIARVALLLLGACQSASGLTPGATWENSLGMKFVPVPGTNVLFSVWETRVQDYEAFVKATSRADQRWRTPGDTGDGHVDGFSQTPLHPVVNVSWTDAVAFCGWLTDKERAANTLAAGQEFRLPSDDEWSRAVGLPAESGSSPEDKGAKQADVYPWGARYPPPSRSGNYSGEHDGWSGAIAGYTDGARFTAEVGSYTANKLGIHDLGGNVWEWCGDWFNTEREGRVIRGGSFNQGAASRLVSSHRASKPPSAWMFNLGFRCVLSSP